MISFNRRGGGCILSGGLEPLFTQLVFLCWLYRRDTCHIHSIESRSFIYFSLANLSNKRAQTVSVSCQNNAVSVVCVLSPPVTLRPARLYSITVFPFSELKLGQKIPKISRVSALSLPLPRSSDVNCALFILEECRTQKDQVSVMHYFSVLRFMWRERWRAHVWYKELIINGHWLFFNILLISHNVKQFVYHFLNQTVLWIWLPGWDCRAFNVLLSRALKSI